MYIQKVSYFENKSNLAVRNYWEVQDLSFNRSFNLVVGKNATGKSRVLSIIHNFAKMISQREMVGLFNGNWDIEFNDKNSIFSYRVEIENGFVIKEEILENGVEKLNRTKNLTTITSATNGQSKINPPNTKLVLHVRRDELEYPFLEKIINWAEETYFFSFSATITTNIDVPLTPSNSNNVLTLNAVPTVLAEMKPAEIVDIISEFNTMGYDVVDAKADSGINFPPPFKALFIKEKNIKFPIDQSSISQGMYRAFSLLVILNYYLSSKRESLFVIDDLCEGLDYERSVKFTKLIISKIKKKNIQIISSSNDSFLMNEITVKDWNYLYRKDNIVKSINYSNNKDLFENFKYTGLNNFDFFASDYLNEVIDK